MFVVVAISISYENAEVEVIAEISYHSDIATTEFDRATKGAVRQSGRV